jgi:divalent metal cation (Fe/Co/Zn/Cd) transporter
MSPVVSGNEAELAASERVASLWTRHGHGKALYFYSLLVAVYIFGVGGGLAVHHGITHLRNPQLPDHPG